MNDIEEPQELADPGEGPDFSLPDEMFRSVDKDPEKIKIAMWKRTDAGLEAHATDAEYVEIDGLAIFEGDIVLGTVDEIEAARASPVAAQAKGIGIVSINGEFRWRHGEIPYIVEDDEILRHKVDLAIAHWQKHTPFTFIPRTADNENEFPDFISFENNGVCQSMIGCRGGMQTVSIGDGCTAGSAIHEIGHAIGLFHEQSRSDRDTFIKVVDANINVNAKFNFRIQIQGATDLGDYDYASIMHYSSKAFSINNQPTIVPLQPGAVIGQRNGLSKGDVESVKKLYSNLNWAGVTPIP